MSRSLTIIQQRAAATWLLLAIAFFGCAEEDESKPSSKTKSSEVANSSQTIEQNLAEFSFRNDLHPVLTKNCGACHGASISPKFAVAEPEVSEQTLRDAGKINLSEPAKSRIYLRLHEDQHNCWSQCSDDASVMLGLLERWAASLEDKTADSGAALPLPKIVTQPLKLSDLAYDIQPNPNPDGTFYFEAEMGEIDLRTGTTMVRVPGSGTASGRSYVETPVGTTIREDNRGWIQFPLDIPQPGIYTVWGRVSGSNMFVEVYDPTDPPPGEGTPTRISWSFPAAPAGQPATSWRWGSLKAPNSSTVARQFSLRAGRAFIRVLSNAANSRLDVLVVTANPFFDPEQAYQTTPPNHPVLRYSLVEATGISDLFLTVQARTKTETSLIFSHPSLWLSRDGVYVRGLRPIINGENLKQYATWSEIDLGVLAPGDQLYVPPMIAIIPADATIAWGFDLIEPAKADRGGGGAP